MLIKLRRLWSRQLLTIEIIIICSILSFWAGTAYGTEPKKTLSKHNYIKTVQRPKFIPTSTTTTTAPRPIKTPNTVAVNSVQSTQGSANTYSVPQGDWVEQCRIWATMAGIELTDEAILLISRESSCNPTILNPSSSAGGIAQALPFSKTGCALEYSDAAAICQLKWMHGYVMGRYGGWAQANRAWESRSPHWY